MRHVSLKRLESITLLLNVATMRPEKERSSYSAVTGFVHSSIEGSETLGRLGPHFGLRFYP
jgi:hypothetical protein